MFIVQCDPYEMPLLGKFSAVFSISDSDKATNHFRNASAPRIFCCDIKESATEAVAQLCKINIKSTKKKAFQS
jgi:hypothetical protein